MPYADHARNITCDRRYRRTEARRSSWRTYYRSRGLAALAAEKRARRRQKRIDLHRRDGWRCHYCGKRGNLKTLTMDHKLARKDHGPSTPDNLVSACRRCNCRKGSQGYADFVHQIRAERGLEPLWLIGENMLALEDEIRGLTRARQTEYSGARG